MITTENSIRQIASLPQFADFGAQILPGRGIPQFLISSLKLRNLSKLCPAAGMTDGFNYLDALVAEGKKVYHTVSPAESGKEKMGIFHFPVDKKAKPVIICPGGAYMMVCSFVEGFPVAKRINELGYHAFVVNYRTGKKALTPNPQDDLAAAIRYIADHAEELNVDASDYLLGGFSAGGHLAASFGTEQLGYSRYALPKPGAMFLAYPVITMGAYTHETSRNLLLGKEKKNPAAIEKYSVEKQVTAAYPPTYLWQCQRDDTVSIENSVMLDRALTDAGIDHIYKTYNSSNHGIGIATGTPAQGWLEEAVDFWQSKWKE